MPYCLKQEHFYQKLTKPPLDTASHLSTFLPVSYIINQNDVDLEKSYAKNILLLSYRAVVRAIEACLSGKYSDFDGHTTTNCCHGMALLACKLIQSVLQLDLHQFLLEGKEKIHLLEQCTLDPQPCNWFVPKSILNLAGMYILCLIRESDFLLGNRTIPTRLKALSPIGTAWCGKIAHSLKKRFANWVAMAYTRYAEELPNEMHVSGAPVKMWGKYVDDHFLRTDKHGLKYASNLFSMQVVLAYLIYSRAKVALITDIRSVDGNERGRFVAIFQGDGHKNLNVLTSEEIQANFSYGQEPVIVLGGCVYSDDLNKESLASQIKPWMSRVTNLMLACDVYYPQFVKIVDDTEFDSHPIVPSEELLRNLIEQHSTVQGVSSLDPFLYCSTHIYPASLAQVLQVINEENNQILPVSFIPNVKMHSLSETKCKKGPEP